MFNNMKNKIREKTGSDLPKLSVTPKPGLGRHSRQGSETSISSLVLDTPSKEEVTTPTSTAANMEFTLADGKSLTAKELTKLAKREDEWRNRLEKRDADWTKKMEKKEAEMVKIMEDKEREWRKQEQMLTEDLLKLTKELKEALKVAEESKRKICEYQEDKDQLEGFQMQEMSKIKHLLLAKEQESAENTAALKKNITLVDSLRAEVNRLRPFEEQVSNFQAVAKSDSMDLASKVVELEHQYSQVQAECARLQEELESEQVKANVAMEEERVRLRKLKEELDQERGLREEISGVVEKERREKDDALMRNAQISQEAELTRQELRAQQQDSDELFKKNSTMEKQLTDKTQELEKMRVELNNLSLEMVELRTVAHDSATASATEKELRQKVSDLENQLVDRSKTVRVLQQRLTDMKKTLQRELKAADPGGGEITSNNHSVTNSRPLVPSTDEDVNFKYLKHVLIKFLTCREYEAQHLTRAVATLLKLSQEEERLLRETLEWRKSWFGSRPRLSKTKPLFPS